MTATLAILHTLVFWDLLVLALVLWNSAETVATSSIPCLNSWTHQSTFVNLMHCISVGNGANLYTYDQVFLEVIQWCVQSFLVVGTA